MDHINTAHALRMPSGQLVGRWWPLYLVIWIWVITWWSLCSTTGPQACVWFVIKQTQKQQACRITRCKEPVRRVIHPQWWYSTWELERNWEQNEERYIKMHKKESKRVIISILLSKPYSHSQYMGWIKHKQPNSSFISMYPQLGMSVIVYKRVHTIWALYTHSYYTVIIWGAPCDIVPKIHFLCCWKGLSKYYHIT